MSVTGASITSRIKQKKKKTVGQMVGSCYNFMCYGKTDNNIFDILTDSDDENERVVLNKLIMKKQEDNIRKQNRLINHLRKSKGKKATKNDESDLSQSECDTEGSIIQILRLGGRNEFDHVKPGRI